MKYRIVTNGHIYKLQGFDLFRWATLHFHYEGRAVFDTLEEAIKARDTQISREGPWKVVRE